MFLSHIDNFAVEKKYLAPRIQVALEFLRKTDWSSKADGKYVIDAATCIDCGACEGVCPVEAISQAS